MAAQHTKHSPGGGAHLAGGAGQQQQNVGGSQGGSSAALSDAKESAREAGEQIKDSAQSAAESLRQQGEGFFAEKKSQAASELTTFSSAIRSAADKLRSDDESHAASYADMAADRLEGAARFIGDQDVGSLVHEIERAARRRPELFLGGMFLVGLGISRFLKASSPSQPEYGRDWRTQDSPNN